MPYTENVMKIGIIGAGGIAQAVAKQALGAGYEVILSNSRGPETLKAVVQAPWCRCGGRQRARSGARGSRRARSAMVERRQGARGTARLERPYSHRRDQPHRRPAGLQAGRPRRQDVEPSGRIARTWGARREGVEHLDRRESQRRSARSGRSARNLHVGRRRTREEGSDESARSHRVRDDRPRARSRSAARCSSFPADRCRFTT